MPIKYPEAVWMYSDKCSLGERYTLQEVYVAKGDHLDCKYCRQEFKDNDLAYSSNTSTNVYCAECGMREGQVV
jgi:hypothetical protein